MRNLKRALSLTLASVMLLGMMVVGASAKGYPDVDENDNVEAIEVLQAIEVMRGDDNGDFNPDSPVTRSEMAVVMALLLNLDYQYYETTCPFWDVPTWARPYVGACYANGIVSGYSDNTYGAADGVTAIQAASMMMRALGYFQHTEDYAGNFELATVRQGTEIGIFTGVGSDATAAMTRNQVAQMALNALRSEMVTFTGTTGFELNGVTVGYQGQYTKRTGTESKYNAIAGLTTTILTDNGQYFIQLGEELYDGKLVRKTDRDDFMRPSINWQYNGKNIGTYVDYSLLVTNGTYTDGVKYSELYDLLTYTTIRDNDLARYVDGVDQNESKDNFYRSNDSKVGGTGVLTEVFLDQTRDEITITSINTYLAKANSDYNSSTETLSLKVYQSNENGSTFTVDSAVVPDITGAKKDDFMLVYLSGKDSNSTTRMDVVQTFPVDIMVDSTITKFTRATDDKVVSKLTTGGVEYSTNPKAYYDKDESVLGRYDNQLLTDTSYNIYLDRYGNVIGVDIYEGTRNYVFITGYDRGTSHISTRTADAAAIFLDGTMDVITVNVTDTDKNIDRVSDPYFTKWEVNSAGRVSENRWYTYTVNNSGIYTLRPATSMFASDYTGGTVLNTANLYVDDNGTTTWNGNVKIDGTKGRAYGEDASIYITVESGHVDESAPGVKDAITEVKGVYTGIQDLKMEIAAPTAGTDQIPNRVYTLYDSDYFIIAAIVVGEAQGSVANYAYILGNVKSEEYVAGESSRASDTGVYYWEFDAFYQGEKTTLTARTKYPGDDYLTPYTIQELRFDGSYVTDVRDVDLSKTHTKNTTNNKIENMDIYDVGRVTGTGWNGNTEWDDNHVYVHNTNDNPAGNGGASAARLYGTIYLQGRTLYVGEGRSDVGLALARDAKALLVQSENNAGVETRAYNSVDEAVSNIADYDDDSAGTQFRGRIAAVLDGRGAAEWVVIISDTELTSTTRPSYGSAYRFVDELHGSWTLYVPIKEWNENPTTTQIANWLTSAGCSNVSANQGLWNFTYRGYNYTNQTVEVKDQNGTSLSDKEISTPTVTMPATLNLNQNLPHYDVENDAHYDVNTVWTLGGEVVTTAASYGTYHWTVTLTAKSGYTFADGKTVELSGTATCESNEGIPVRTDDTHGWPIYAIDEEIDDIVTSVTAGQKIKTDPEYAVEFTAGVSSQPDANGYYTVLDDAEEVVISVKSGFTYYPSRYMWNSATDGIDVNLYGDLLSAPSANSMSRAATLPGTEDSLIEGDPLWLVRAIIAARRATNCVLMQDGSDAWYIGTAARPWLIRPLSSNVSANDFFTSSVETTVRVGTGWSGELDMHVTADGNGHVTTADVVSALGEPLPGTVPATTIVLTDSETGEETATAKIEVDEDTSTATITVTPAAGIQFVEGSVVDGDELTEEDIAVDGSVTGSTEVDVEPEEPDDETPADETKVYLTVNFPEGYTVTVDTNGSAEGGNAVAVTGEKLEVLKNTEITMTIVSRTRGQKVTVSDNLTADEEMPTNYTLSVGEENVTANVTAASAGTPHDIILTLIGNTSFTPAVTARTGNDTGVTFNSDIEKVTDADGNEVWTIKGVYPGETVVMKWGNGSSGSSTIGIDGVLVKATENATNGFVTFQMPDKEFALGINKSNGKLTDANGETPANVATITVYDGVAVTWTSADAGTNGTITSTASASTTENVPSGATLTITNTGSGDYVITGSSGYSTSTVYTAEENHNTVESVTSGMELRSARKIELIGTGTSIKIDSNSVDATGNPAKATAYVAVSKTVTFEKGDYSGLVANSIVSSNISTLPAGSSDATVYAAYQVVVGDGINSVKAKLGDTTADVTGTQYVAAGATLTGTVDSTKGTDAVNYDLTNAYYAPAGTEALDLVSGETVSGGMTLNAATKVTFTSAVAYRVNAANQNIYIPSETVSPQGVEMFVKNGTEFTFHSFNTGANLDVTVGTTKTSYADGAAVLTVGAAAVTVEGGETANSVSAQIVFIQDEASFKEALAAGWSGRISGDKYARWGQYMSQAAADALNSNERAGVTVEDIRNNTTLPWLFIVLDTKDGQVTSLKDVKVYGPDNKLLYAEQSQNVASAASYDPEVVESTIVGVTYPLEMKSNQYAGSGQYLNQTTVAEGTYTVSFVPVMAGDEEGATVTISKTFKATTENDPLVTATAVIIHDEDSFNEAVKAGYSKKLNSDGTLLAAWDTSKPTGVITSGEEEIALAEAETVQYDNIFGNTTLPWFMVMVNGAYDEVIGCKVIVYQGEGDSKTKLGEMIADTGLAGKDAEGATTFHWEVKTTQDNSVSAFSSNLTAGTVTIELHPILQGESSTVANRVITKTFTVYAEDLVAATNPNNTQEDSGD